ncbi:MAG: TIGR00282 family metallophosphoesterase [Elusimicrobiota bacterium]
MNILFIGDIVGRPGRRTVKKVLKSIIEKYKVDFVIANCENSAGGMGITANVMKELLDMGIDMLTSGNHIWKRRKEVEKVINNPKLLRPANYPDLAPGRGFNVYTSDNKKIGVINLQGRVFMESIDNPFSVIDGVLEQMKETKNIIVDFHAEATSEKMAMAWYLDGKVSAVIGTHTHVQTSDEVIMPDGTAYITDAGMTGSKSGVIGVEKEEIIKKFLTGMPFRFKVAKENEQLEGVLIKTDDKTGRSIAVNRINIKK